MSNFIWIRLETPLHEAPLVCHLGDRVADGVQDFHRLRQEVRRGIFRFSQWTRGSNRHSGLGLGRSIGLEKERAMNPKLLHLK